MENFKWYDKEIEFKNFTGEVFNDKKYSETHVSSSGGGGYVDPQYGGNVRAAQVQSTVVSVHDFWIKDEAGEEHPINLRGHDIPLATGQKLTLVSIGLIGGPPQHAVLLHNHNIKKYWTLCTAKTLHLYYFNEPQVNYLTRWFIYTVAYILMLIYTSGAVMWAIHIGIIIYVAIRYLRYAKMCKALDAHIEKIAQVNFLKTN